MRFQFVPEIMAVRQRLASRFRKPLGSKSGKSNHIISWNTHQAREMNPLLFGSPARVMRKLEPSSGLCLWYSFRKFTSLSCQPWRLQTYRNGTSAENYLSPIRPLYVS